VASAGDVDGDGLDDFLIGAPDEGNPLLPQGGVFLIFGSKHFPQVIDVGAALPRFGVLFTLSQPDGLLGLSGAGIGDLNGDGFSDIALGMPGGLTSIGGERRATGKVFVILGGTALRDGPSVRSLDGPPFPGGAPPGFEIDGVSEESEFGFSVAGAGDADGDGKADFVIGAPRSSPGGSVFLIFGRDGLGEAPGLAPPDGNGATELRHGAAQGRLGEALSGGIDITGDSVADLILGAPESLEEGAPAGAAYLLPGGPILRGAGILTVPEGRTFTLRGSRGSRTGASVALVPDLGGDRVGEALVGAPGAGAGRGAAYLVYGGHAPGAELVEQLTEEEGARFIANSFARLGKAVAGLPDRNGDARGDFALGAPGFPAHGVPSSGAVFEVFLPVDPESPAPRNLSATPIPGARVRVTWMISRVYRSLRVYRDDAPVSPPLPGHILKYIDTSPGAGRHVYFVEADQDPGLRSNLDDVQVRSFAVRDLTCRQLEGVNRILVTWFLGDDYQALQVFLDGRPASDLLSSSTTRYELDVPPGDHLVEVFDPLTTPEGERASCEVSVDLPELPQIGGFTCAVEPPQNVRLRWEPKPAYSAFSITRNGAEVARVTESEYLDEGAPPGRLVYELRGVVGGLHRGPRETCEVNVSSPGGSLLDGRIEWMGGGRVGRGTIQVLDAQGQEVSRVQVAESGEFHAPLFRPGPYRVVFKASLKSAQLTSSGVHLSVEPSEITVSRANVPEGAELRLEIPAPVILVSSPAESPVDPSLTRWNQLRARLTGQVLSFPLVLPAGVSHAAALLSRVVGEVKGYLARELDAAPPGTVDLVAYGSAGLAARLYLASLPERGIRKLILLGTPNLGTRRGNLEARAELAGRPLRLLETEDGGGGGRGAGEIEFFGGVEQTEAFLVEFNRRVTETRGAEVHLVAGTGGLQVLDPVLGCDSHDDRVCEASALGGVEGATPHRLLENHETLGRGTLSVDLIAGQLLGGAGAGLLALDAGDEGAGDEGAGDGGGAQADISHPQGDTYSGVLEADGLGALPLVSDTSESIIIILNSELPGGIHFNIQTPADGSDRLIDPFAAGALPDVDYQTYGDGEGHEIQAYRFRPSEIGTYTALLENPATNAAIAYSLELWIESDVALEVSVDPQEILPGETARVSAHLTKRGLPLPGATAGARIWRPDGGLDVISLLDDGQGADLAAGDGIYVGEVPSSSQPGIHQVEVTASSSVGPVTLFHREASASLRVRSDAAKLAETFSSGTTDPNGDGVLDSLWIEGSVIGKDPGIFLVIGSLSDPAGNPVAKGGALFSLDGPRTITFRLYFDGSDIFASQRNGPFALSSVELLDGSAGFVVAGSLQNAHTTDMHLWNEFGLLSPMKFKRGDANTDGKVDISDGIAVLDFLFTGQTSLDCEDAGDANRRGGVDVSDAAYLFSFLFLGGPVPPEPFPTCGTAEESVAGCAKYPPCN
jgi:hypothetical protein